MLNLRKNATSAHTHYVHGIGEHDVYVECGGLNQRLSREWLRGAIAAFVAVNPDVTKIGGKRLYAIADKYATAYGRNGIAVELSAEQTAVVDTLLETPHTSRLPDGGIKLGWQRYFLMRQYFVSALASMIRSAVAAGVDATPPKTIDGLENLISGIARRDGTIAHNHAPVMDAAGIAADDCIFALLPMFGAKYPRETAPIAPPADESTTGELIVAPAVDDATGDAGGVVIDSVAAETETADEPETVAAETAEFVPVVDAPPVDAPAFVVTGKRHNKRKRN